jgi:hypothetical protein
MRIAGVTGANQAGLAVIERAAGSALCDPATSPSGGCWMISLDSKIFDSVSRLTAPGGTT